MFSPAILDALAPYVGVPTGLQLGQCSKELKAGLDERIMEVIESDHDTWQVVMCKAINDTQKPTLQDIKDTDSALAKHDFSQLSTLFRKTNITMDMDFQDFFFERYVFNDTDYKTIDPHIVGMLRDVLNYFETLQDHETKVLSFLFSARLISCYIQWIINNDFQNKVLSNDDMLRGDVISHTHFMQVMINRVWYFEKHAHVIPDKYTREEYLGEMRFNKKYMKAWLQKLYKPKTELFIGPLGGIYTTTPTGSRRYFN